MFFSSSKVVKEARVIVVCGPTSALRWPDDSKKDSYMRSQTQTQTETLTKLGCFYSRDVISLRHVV